MNREEDVASFQELKEAFDRAINWTKNQKEENTNYIKKEALYNNDADSMEYKLSAENQKELSEWIDSKKAYWFDFNLNSSQNNVIKNNLVTQLSEFILMKGLTKWLFMSGDQKEILLSKQLEKLIFQSEEVVDEVQLELVYYEVNKLYGDFKRRIKLENWEKLFENKIIRLTKDYEEQQAFFTDFLLTNYYYLPQPVVSFLWKTFYLEEYTSISMKSYSHGEITDRIEQIKKLPNFSFDLLIDLEEKVRQKFLEARLVAYFYIEKGQFVLGERKISEAQRYFDSDPELLLMKTYFQIKDSKNGYVWLIKFMAYLPTILILNKIIKLDPTNPVARIYRAYFKTSLKFTVNKEDLTYLNVAEECDFFEKNYILGWLAVERHSYQEAYDWLLNLDDYREAYSRKRITKAIRKLKKQEQSKTKKNRYKQELRFYSLISFLPLYLKRKPLVKLVCVFLYFYLIGAVVLTGTLASFFLYCILCLLGISMFSYPIRNRYVRRMHEYYKQNAPNFYKNQS
ncbi:hypothetical protein [Carnobacterium maltaromaticum]|nr:hypothetical protein [Carnobacterium maltaromaticum]